MNDAWKPTAHRSPMMMMSLAALYATPLRTTRCVVEDDSLYGDANGSQLRDPW